MIDTLIIGAGISGLTTALLLAKAGQKVHIVEQQATLGGLLQSYERQGHHYPTGVHYFGFGNSIGRLWQYLGIYEAVPLIKMSEAAGDVLHFPTYEQLIPSEISLWRKQLETDFPNEKEVIDTYLKQMEKTRSHFPLYNFMDMSSEPILEEDSRPLGPWLDSIGASSGLKQAITYLSMLYGVHPDDCPLYVHLIIHDSFLHGTQRLAGGGEAIIKAFSDKLQQAGATWECRAKVEKLAPADEGMQVTLADGRQLSAKQVVFSGDISQLTTIVAPGNFRPSFIHRVEGLEYTAGMFGVALVLKEDNKRLLEQNHFIYSTADAASQLRQNLTGGDIQGFMVSADESGNATIIATMPPTDLAQIVQNGTRSADYKSRKMEVAEKLLAMAQKVLPELADARIVDTYTPFTYQRYIGVKDGASYGVAKNVAQVVSGRFGPYTHLKGLYLAGHSVLLPGICGATISAMAATTAVLGPDWLKKTFKK